MMDLIRVSAAVADAAATKGELWALAVFVCVRNAERKSPTSEGSNAQP
jgi:hypothetical protein